MPYGRAEEALHTGNILARAKPHKSCVPYCPSIWKGVVIIFKYESILLDASSSIKGKLGAKDISILNEAINKRAEDGWELVANSYSVAGYAQFLVTFKKER